MCSIRALLLLSAAFFLGCILSGSSIGNIHESCEDRLSSSRCEADDAESGFTEDEAELNLLQMKATMKHAAESSRKDLQYELEADHAPRVTIESAVSLPDGFEVKGPTPQEQTIHLTFFLKLQNLDVLEDALMNVSDPIHASYGQHWSNDDVQALVAPKDEHLKAVQDFLSSHGVDTTMATANGDVLSAKVTAGHAERILQTRYQAVSHEKTGRILHRCTEGYTLPAHVASALDFVSPTVHLMRPARPLASHSRGSSSPRLTLKEEAMQRRRKHTTTTTTTLPFGNDLVCPGLHPTTAKTLRSLYNIGGTVGQDEDSKQAVTGFIGETYNLQNLKDYWNLYCHGIMCGKGNPGNVGDDTEGTDKSEAMLDVDVITGVAGNIYTEFWGFETHEDEADDPFISWLIKVVSTSDDVIPKVFSTSYGEDEDSLSFLASQRLNAEFAKLGVRGVSILFAAGDEGANSKRKKHNPWHSYGDGEKGKDDKEAADDVDDDLRFEPTGPGTSPFVTTVGATAPAHGYPKPGSETATALSSGGFSNYFKMPKYQREAVKDYLKRKDLPDTKKYSVNTKGRAYPDISAQGYSFCVTPQYVEGVLSCQVGGTSASTPTVSGIFSLLNDLRLGLGKKPLGFLNPLIYRYPEAFNDITTGWNTFNGSCLSHPAWPAGEGWDAVTGVGTPNYAKLADIVRDLP